MNSSFYQCKFKSLFILFFCLFSYFISTAESCECVVHSECYEAACNNGECIYTEKTPTPPGCCTTSSQCTNGTVGGTSCITPNCFTDYYTCANIWICGSTNFPPPPEHSCSTTPDCSYLANYCVNPVCVNNTCVLETIENPGCCDTVHQCMNVPCMNSYCDVALHYCVYVPIPNCVYHSITPSQSSTTSLTSTATATSTMTSTSSASASFTSTATTTTTPTSSTTSTQTSTATSTPTSTSTATQTPTPSSTSTNTGTSTSTASFTPTSSISFSVTPTSSPQPLPPAQDGSNSWIYILLFGGGAIAITVGIGIIAAVIIYLRKKYVYTRVQPDDFIDDEEFPM